MNLSDCWAAERAPLSLVDFKLYTTQNCVILARSVTI